MHARVPSLLESDKRAWLIAAGLHRDAAAPPQIEQVERVIDRWDPDRELELGIAALLHGFERLLP